MITAQQARELRVSAEVDNALKEIEEKIKATASNRRVSQSVQYNTAELSALQLNALRKRLDELGFTWKFGTTPFMTISW
jgi:hypothetical protein